MLKWGVGGLARGGAATVLRLPLAAGVTGTAAGDPPPPLGTKGREELTGDRHCLTGKRWGRGAHQLKEPEGPRPDVLTLTPDPTEALAVALGLHAAADTRWLTVAWVVTCEGVATRPRSIAPYRPHPAPVTVGTAAVLAPATTPLGRPQGPDPRPGRRVSIRPQPTRAPRGEAMDLGPLRGREPTRAVAKGHTLQWGNGGMAGGTAAAALRLPLAPGVNGTATSEPPPPPSGERRGPKG